MSHEPARMSHEAAGSTHDAAATSQADPWEEPSDPHNSVEMIDWEDIFRSLGDEIENESPPGQVGQLTLQAGLQGGVCH